MRMKGKQDIERADADSVARLTAQMSEMRAKMDCLARDNEALSRELDVLARESQATISSLRSQLEGRQAEIERLLEQIRLANRRFFGSRSEKVSPEQLSLFNDVEAAADGSAAEPSLEDVAGKAPGNRRRGGKRKIDLARFETVVVEHELPAEERACRRCGSELEEVGVEVAKRLRLVPAHFVVEEHRTHKYRCRPCCEANAEGGETPSVLVRAHAPKNCLPGSIATPSLISYIVNAKYVNSMPLYRIEGDFASLGAAISRQNMANWVIHAYERWLAKVHGRIRAELLGHKVIHADETEVQVLKEPGRDARSVSRCWLFCSAEADTPAYAYEYRDTRSKAVAEDFLRGWSGTLVTDGYEAYYSLGNGGSIRNVACLVHVRRKFIEVIDSAGGAEKARRAHSVALEARDKINAMFHMDNSFGDVGADERKALRDEKLRPLMEDFGRWLDAQIPKAAPRLKLHGALAYAKKYWPYVMNALDDGGAALSNNVAERGIKPFVIGRKNWLFSDTPRGAQASCGMYSIVTTARMNGISPRPYIEWLLTELPNAGELTEDVLDSFMPWSDKVPQSFRLAPEKARELAEMAEEPIVDIDPGTIPKDR